MRVFVWDDAHGQHFQEVPTGAKPEEYGVPEDARQVSRMPKDFERHNGDTFVKDEAAEAEYLENARLRLLSPSKRHQEAIDRAAERAAGRGGPA